jgi:hypothetical protein
VNFVMTEFSEVRYRKQRTCNSKNMMFGDTPPLASRVKLPALANGAGVRNRHRLTGGRVK